MTKRDQIERDYLNGMSLDDLAAKHGYSGKNSISTSMHRWGIKLPESELYKRQSAGSAKGLITRLRSV